MRGRQQLRRTTPVLLAAGAIVAIVAIKDVKAGDLVLAADPATGPNAPQAATAIHINQDVVLTDVTVQDTGGHQATLHTTQDHLFWNATTTQWVEAATLRPTDNLVTPEDVLVRVIKVATFTGQQVMYNLTVADSHTYYVLAGNTPILVHNDGGLTPEQERSLRSLQARSAEHQAKLGAYRANPDAYDNDGRLKNAPTPEIRQRIIDGRINHLQK